MSFAYNPFTDNLDYKASSSGGGTVTSVSGTADRITSTGGATPVIDIASTYVGQTSITTLGTVATGVWSGTAIAAIKGGTGFTTYTTGDLIYASAANTLSKLAVGSNTNVLTLAGGVPTWAAPSASGVTISGDSGTSSASATQTISADNANETCGSTVKFITSGTTTTLNVTDSVLGNTFIGLGSGNLIASGGSNTGVGFQSLKVITSGTENTGLGLNSLALNTSGSANTAVGYGALASVDSTSNNTAFGNACLDITTGSNNTAMGSGCLTSFDGSNNCAFGYLAGRDTSGTGNSIFGFLSMVNATSGVNNACYGYQALTSLGSGSTNNAFGYNAGSALTGTDSNNVCLAHTGISGDNNKMRIGTDGSGAGQVNATFIAGISGVTVTGTAVLCASDGQLGTVASSSRYKENIEDIPEDVSVLSLRPVKFNYKADENKSIQYGLIAEEVSKDFPYLCFYKDDKPESVKYHELCTFLLAEIQRLDAKVSYLEYRLDL